MISDELRIMVRPVATYREIAARSDAPERWHFVRKQLFTAFMIGAFVALTTARRLALPFVIDGFISWSFLLVLQTIYVALVLRWMVRPAVPAPRAIAWFFAGQGPFLCWLLAIAGASLFMRVEQADEILSLFGPVIPLSALVAIIWSNVTTFGFMRGAMNLPTRRAVLASTVYGLLMYGTLIGYLFAAEVVQVARLRS